MFIHSSIRIRNAGIIGRGIFTVEKLNKGTFVGEIFLTGEQPLHFNTDIESGRRAGRSGNKFGYGDWRETYPLGKYVNHSYDPNCDVIEEDSSINLVTNIEILSRAELRCNYFEIAKIIKILKSDWEDIFYSRGIPREIN